MQKVDSGGTANFLCDGNTPASAVLKDSSAVYTPGLSERRGTTSKFYHSDALGSTRGITDSTQAVTDSVLYDAFGMAVSRTGTTPTPFGFVGKAQYQTDNDSGLILLGHRYYDASVGRFISSDPAQAGDCWYAYCDNNPLTAVDPEGLDIIYFGSDPYIRRMKKLISKIRNDSPIARKILDPYLRPGKNIKIVQGNNPREYQPDPKSGLPDPVITFPDPIAKMPGFDVGTPHHPKKSPWDPERGFGHELGHVALPNPNPNAPNPDFPYERKIIKEYENPIAKQISKKSLPRTRY